MASLLENLSIKSLLVKEYLTAIVGDESVKIARLCSRKDCSPEEISRKVGMKVSHVRSVLNRMHTLSLVSYTKRIDNGNNWVTYTWKLNLPKLLEAVRESYMAKIENVNNQLELEQNSIFFSCTNGCKRYTLEGAMDHDFRCPACGYELQNVDNAASIEKIQKIKCTLLA